MKLHDGAHVLGEVKTVRSRRSLTIPAPLVEVLRNHRSRWAEERLVFGAQWPAEWAELVGPKALELVRSCLLTYLTDMPAVAHDAEAAATG